MKYTEMKRTIASVAAALGMAAMPAMAQQVMEGGAYYLPKTTLQVVLRVEKTTTQPGELCQYADRFLKKSNVPTEASTTYRLLSAEIWPSAIADTAHQYTARIDAHHSIQRVMISADGIILSVNAEPKLPPTRQPFTPAPKAKALNAHDYMNQDILASGSKAKMAELTAQEIYDIRESRSMLSKGQADFMPKDGEQLRIMMQSLDTQERALLQEFEGITTRDTSEVVLTCLPQGEVRGDVLFRFSRHFGLVDKDDLSGEPYYISIADLHQVPENSAVAEGKLPKDNAEIYVNMPGRAKVSIATGEATIAEKDLPMTQFGRTQPLDNELFGKKLFTQLIYHPLTGNIESIKTEMVKK